MKLLLDTHATLWFMLGDKQLPERIRNSIANPLNDVYASAVCALEIATKYRIGKLPDAAELAQNFVEIVMAQGFLGLPISLEHARMAGGLIHRHRDPSDRLLIAQALIDDAYLVSNEVLFDEFGVKRMW